MNTPLDDTADYAAQVTETLWPGSGAERPLVALPSVSTPRMLVPARPARAAASAVRGLTAARGVRGRIRRTVVTAALRGGAGRLVARRSRWSVRGGGIAEYVSEVVGTAVDVGVLVGAPRANRKPVLVLVRPDGALLGYAKVGLSALAGALVSAEASALQRLERMPLDELAAPALLHRGTWRSFEVTVQTPLNTSRARACSLHATVAALRELAAIDTGSWPLAECPAWTSAIGRLEAVLAAGPGLPGDSVAWTPRAERLLTAAHRLATAHGHRAVPIGAWHGDWTPWNVAKRGAGLLAWDWERFATGVPVGWDALHWTIQRQAGPRGQELPGAAWRLLTAAAGLLAPFGVAAPAAPAVAGAYLVEIGSRYVHDRAPGMPGAVEQWLLPALEAQIARGGSRT